MLNEQSPRIPYHHRFSAFCACYSVVCANPKSSFYRLSMVKRAFQGGFLAALFFLVANLSVAFGASEKGANSNALNSQDINSSQNEMNLGKFNQKFVLVNDNILKEEAVAKLNEIGAELKKESNITLALAVSIAGLNELESLQQGLETPYLLFVMSLLDKKVKVQSKGIWQRNEEATQVSEKVLESSVYPLLGQKNPSYAAALFNGYADFADTLAKHAKINLNTSIGNANRQTMSVFRILFYGIIFIAVLYYVSKKSRKTRNER